MSVGFANWFVKFKRYSKFALKTVLKINWSVKMPWHERMEVARSGLWAPDQPRNYCVPELYSSFDQQWTHVAYMYINCCENTEGEYKKRMNHFKKFPPKKTIRRIKQKTKETKLLRHRNSKVKNIMLLLLIKTKKILFVCLFLFSFTRGVMKPWDQAR